MTASIVRRWRTAMAGAGLKPTAVVEAVLERIAARGDDKVWIRVFPPEELLAEARRLEAGGPADKPLCGIPFAIKDCLDLAGHPTTVGLPAFAYRPERTATAVQRLIDAGAIPVGKTNLDQFASGLNGTRSPYGAPGSALAPAYIAGGSSSGSAVAVAAGARGFALGSDTAGSGRVPAQFNNIVGFKPSRGVVSTGGSLPGVPFDRLPVHFRALRRRRTGRFRDRQRLRSLEQQFSRQQMPTGLTRGGERDALRRAAAGRPRILRQPCRTDTIRRHGREHRRPRRRTLVDIDLSPFLAAARLLYEGPWIAERYLAIRDFIERQPEALHPVTRAIIARGGTRSARPRPLPLNNACAN